MKFISHQTAPAATRYIYKEVKRTTENEVDGTIADQIETSLESLHTGQELHELNSNVVNDYLTQTILPSLQGKQLQIDTRDMGEAGKLRLRSQPGSGDNILTSYSEGTQVKFLNEIQSEPKDDNNAEKQEDYHFWLKVEITNAETGEVQQGWMSGEYLRETVTAKDNADDNTATNKDAADKKSAQDASDVEGQNHGPAQDASDVDGQNDGSAQDASDVNGQNASPAQDAPSSTPDAVDTTTGDQATQNNGSAQEATAANKASPEKTQATPAFFENLTLAPLADQLEALYNESSSEEQALMRSVLNSQYAFDENYVEVHNKLVRDPENGGLKPVIELDPYGWESQSNFYLGKMSVTSKANFFEALTDIQRDLSIRGHLDRPSASKAPIDSEVPQ